MDEELLNKIFPFRRNFLNCAGVRLHYVDEGTGPVIMMFHASPMWSFSYRNQIREFAKDHRVIAMDLPGYGLSDKKQDFSYTLSNYVSVLESFIEKLDLHDMVFVLHGWGGTVAMSYAVRHPKEIRGLVVMNSTAFAEWSLPWRMVLCRIPWLGARLVVDLRLLLWGMRKEMSRETAEAYLFPYRDRNARKALYRFVRDIPTVPEADSAQMMFEIENNLWTVREKPSCILWADFDWLYHRKLLKHWKYFLPHAEVFHLPNAGRYIQEDASDELNTLIRRFLSANNL